MHHLLRILILTCLIFTQSALAAYYTYDNSATVASTYPWIDISASSATPGTSVKLTNNSVSSAISLGGFTFNFGGSNYTQLQIGSNGLLFFSSTITTSGTNTALPETDAANGVMLPFWDDLKPFALDNKFMYRAFGTAPNRYFVVSFLDLQHQPNTGSYTFQVQIYENGNFVYRYGATTDSGLSATVGVQVSATDYVQYSYSTASVPNDTTILWKPIPLVGAIGGFNAFETSTATAAITGVIKTKIAGSAFNLDLIALNTAKTAVATTFTGTVKVELLDSSSGGTLDSNGCNTNWPNIQTLATSPAFSSTNAGRKTVSFQENNAWPNVRVRISYPATGTPTTIGCSTDNFAIRPNAFSNISVSDNTWSTAGTARTLYNTAATGGNVHKAGQAFSMGATAVNALSTPTATSNYAGTPAAALVTCLQPASGCNLGVLNVGTWAAASGTITTSTATYSEAGAFTMQLSDTSFASVDAADSTAAERTITSASFSTGRFVPDHFDLSTSSTPQFRTFNTTDSNCNTAATAPKRRFTYIGQGFGYVTTPQAMLTARNAGGATTQNYQGALWHSPIPTSSYSSTHTLDTSLTTLPVVTSNNNGTGSININASDTLAYTRNTTAPQNQFNADIALSLNASDTSENAVTGNGTIATNAAAVFNGTGTGIAFDASNSFRYGRLSLSNANGAETLDLPVPMTTQYWNGTNFITNTDDYCTKVSANNITMQNYTKNLAACETAISLSGPFNAGKGNLKLIKPGSGNNGSVDLPVNLGATATGQTCIAPLPATQQATTPAAQSYLQGKWSGTTYDKNPTARATFGVYKNANEFIYMREMY